MLSDIASVCIILVAAVYLGERGHTYALLLKYKRTMKSVNAAHRRLKLATHAAELAAEFNWAHTGKKIAQSYAETASCDAYMGIINAPEQMVKVIKAQYIYFLVSCLTRREVAEYTDALKKAAPTADQGEEIAERADASIEHIDGHRMSLMSYGYNVKALEQEFAPA